MGGWRIIVSAFDGRLCFATRLCMLQYVLVRHERETDVECSPQLLSKSQHRQSLTTRVTLLRRCDRGESRALGCHPSSSSVSIFTTRGGVVASRCSSSCGPGVRWSYAASVNTTSRISFSVGAYSRTPAVSWSSSRWSLAQRVGIIARNLR